MRYAILADYGIDEHDHPIVDLLIHLAYFVHELVEDNPKTGSTWMEIRYNNLVCGPHEDAHRFVNAAFEGDWEAVWNNIRHYTDDLPDDVGKHGPKGAGELIWQLADLGNSVLRTVPEGWDEWPESFYQSTFEMDLGDHDEDPD
ncbi:hypothetical protein CQY21_21550 [Mycolicibacterium boenickei]|nr:hypothetical protein CQY21_21550 [Mycolicibacterium boenickei]